MWDNIYSTNWLLKVELFPNSNFEIALYLDKDCIMHDCCRRWNHTNTFLIIMTRLELALFADQKEEAVFMSH